MLLLVPLLFLFYDFLLSHFHTEGKQIAKRRNLFIGKNVHILHLLTNKKNTLLFAFVTNYKQYTLSVISLQGATAEIIQQINNIPYIHSMILSNDEKTLYITNHFMLYILDCNDVNNIRIITTYKLSNDTKGFPFKTYLLESPNIYYSTIGWTHTISLSKDNSILYLAGPKGLYFFDITNPEKIRLIHQLNDKSYYNVRLLDTTHLLVSSHNTLDILDIADIKHPATISSIPLSGIAPKDIVLTNNKKAFISFGYNANLMHITIDNKYILHHINTISTSPAKYVENLFAAYDGSLLLVEDKRLHVFDMHYPLEPKKIATISCSDSSNPPIESSFYSNHRHTLYLGCFNGSIEIIPNEFFNKNLHD